jgi:integrase
VNNRLVPLPQRTLQALRYYWQTHRHPRYLFPGKEGKPNSLMNRGGIQKAMKKVIRELTMTPIVKFRELTMTPIVKFGDCYLQCCYLIFVITITVRLK